MIIGLHHVGLVVADLTAACTAWEMLLGLKAQDFRNNQGKGFQLDARIMIPNGCWLHLVQNWNPESRVNRYLCTKGEGLEHLALQTDDIEADVAHLRRIGVPLYQDTIFNAADGFEAFVYPEDAIGFTVELIQPHATSWQHNASQVTNPNLLGLQHIGVAVKDVGRAASRFEELFGLKATNLRTDQHQGEQRDVMVEPGNPYMWLHLVEPRGPDHRASQYMAVHGEGLEHLCLEFRDIRDAVKQVRAAAVPLYQNKIYLDREDGFEAFIYPQHLHGVTIELIEPYASSRGYRFAGIPQGAVRENA
jgi:4-hydroxyphenylpyruvate dioxygenase-like putative hemolysin